MRSISTPIAIFLLSGINVFGFTCIEVSRRNSALFATKVKETTTKPSVTNEATDGKSIAFRMTVPHVNGSSGDFMKQKTNPSWNINEMNYFTLFKKSERFEADKDGKKPTRIPILTEDEAPAPVDSTSTATEKSVRMSIPHVNGSSGDFMKQNTNPSWNFNDSNYMTFREAKRQFKAAEKVEKMSTEIPLPPISSKKLDTSVPAKSSSPPPSPVAGYSFIFFKDTNPSWQIESEGVVNKGFYGKKK